MENNENGEILDEIFSEENTDFSQSESENTIEVENNENNISVNDEQMDNDYFQPADDFIPIEYSEIRKKEPMAKGVKIFAFLMAFVILLSCACFVGYRAGENSANNLNPLVELDLETKPENTNQMTLSQLYQNCAKSIVGITVYNSDGNSSLASGVVYSDEGYIITNDHIYADISSPKFKITDNDGNEYDAVFVAGDTRSDLAVLKIDGGILEPAVFGNSSELICGEDVAAIGRPDGLKVNSITSGIVSVTSRRISINTTYNMNLIQTDCPINPGNSGGALFNMFGQVVGITSSKITGTEYDGIGFAIPTTTVKKTVDSLIANGNVDFRCKLGISYTEVTSVVADVTNTSVTGIYVASISEESDLFGKIEVGNIITSVNGIELKDATVLLDVIENATPGDEVEFTVYNTETSKSKNVKAKLIADTGSSSYVK